MAGIYTQSRDLPVIGTLPFVRSVYPDGQQPVPDQKLSVWTRQETTSFRSGQGEKIVSNVELAATNKSLNDYNKTKFVKYDTGHAFSTVKNEAFVNIPMFAYTDYRGMKYNVPTVPGPMWFNGAITSVNYPKVPIWNSDVDGNTAILHTYPTKPQLSLSGAIVELKREGLPSLFGSQIAAMKGSAAKAVGGEFLNSVFGWTPLVADLDKLLKAVVQSSQIVQQLQKDSGKLVRRKYQFPTITETVSSEIARDISAPLASNTIPSVYGTLQITETRTTKKWFSGAFTYYIDPGKDLVGKAIMYEQLASKLLGTRLTPDVLWNLAPWSWLSDWFVNIGNNITVASAFQQDGLVLKYGYVMREVMAQKMYSFTPEPGSSRTPVSQVVLRTSSKERRKSSPFGFGVSDSQFTDRQWAIMGSLGLTNAPRSIR